jgi:hypothetical protein
VDLAAFQQAAALPYPWIEHGKLATARTVKVEVEGDLGGVVGQVPAGQGLVRQRAFQFAATQLCDRFVLQVFSHGIIYSYRNARLRAATALICPAVEQLALTIP